MGCNNFCNTRPSSEKGIDPFGLTLFADSLIPPTFSIFVRVGGAPTFPARVGGGELPLLDLLRKVLKVCGVLVASV